MAIEIFPKQADAAWLAQVRMFLGPGMIESFTVCEILADRDWHAQQLAELRERGATHCSNCEHLFVAVQEAGKRSGDVWRIADSIGIAQLDDEDTYQWLERSISELQAKARRTDRRPRIFTFANGSEIDVDRYLGLDATAISRTDHGDRPAITFQLGHGGFLRVAFESEQQRVDELARLRAFRDGAA